MARHRLVGLDTSPFIYHLDAHPRYGPVVGELFVWIEQRGRAVTSTITMTELLVHSYRMDDLDRVNSIYALTSTYPHLSWVPVTLALADSAARLRAKYGLRTPDALHLATAITGSATGFIGNDHAFQRVTELEILLIDTVAPIPTPTEPSPRQATTPLTQHACTHVRAPPRRSRRFTVIGCVPVQVGTDLPPVGGLKSTLR